MQLSIETGNACKRLMLARWFNGLITTFGLGSSLLQVLTLASVGQGRQMTFWSCKVCSKYIFVRKMLVSWFDEKAFLANKKVNCSNCGSVPCV